MFWLKLPAQKVLGSDSKTHPEFGLASHFDLKCAIDGLPVEHGPVHAKGY